MSGKCQQDKGVKSTVIHKQNRKMLWVGSKLAPVEANSRCEIAHLERRDVGVGDVAVYILDL